MSATALKRGHVIFFDATHNVWRYQDNQLLSVYERTCQSCHRTPTFDGPDPCLGLLPCVSDACCGHGVSENAYVIFENGQEHHGAHALQLMMLMKRISPVVTMEVL